MIGLGAMGRSLLFQSLRTPDVAIPCVAEVNLGPALEFVRSLEITHRVVSGAGAMQDALASGELALCEDARLVSSADGLDVLIDASACIGDALAWNREALDHGMHIVLMNSEVDLAFGPVLLREAEARGLVMTSCDGDQHTVIRRMIAEVEDWGFAPVMAGNIKGFLDRRATPASIALEAAKRDLDPRMCASYTDGTKLCIEMALLANALGYRTPSPGMSGPRARHVREVFGLFDFDAVRAAGTAVVDYILGAEPDGGVFVVGHCDHPYQRGMLRYLKMGDGPFYLFYRPYHLCGVEAMRCIREAAEGRALLKPDAGYATQVFAHAKRPLRSGERLDGIGGTTVYGLIENMPACGALPAGLPVWLAEDVAVLRNIPQDAPVLLDDVRLDADNPEAAAWLAEFRTHAAAG